MASRSPIFFLFLAAIVGSFLSSFFPGWIGLIFCILAIICFFSKLTLNSVLILFLFFVGFSWILAPAAPPYGESFVIGKVSRSSSNVVKLSDVQFHTPSGWKRGRSIIVFLPRWIHAAPIPADEFMARVDKKGGKVEMLDGFWLDMSSSLTDRFIRWGIGISDYLYSQMKGYIFGEADTIASVFLGRREVSFNLKRMYRNGGYAQIFSVSGMHVGIISMITLLILSEFVPWNIVKYPIALVIVTMYGAITGFSIPTFRAIFIFALFALFKIIDRPQSFLNLLGIVGLFEVIHDGSIIFDASFQLSYSAVIMMAILGPQLPIFKPKWISEALNFTFAANVGVIPFLILNFGRIYVASFLFNAIVVPILMVFILEGAMFFSFFALMGVGTMERILGAGVLPFARSLDWLVKFTNELPLSVVRIHPKVTVFWITFSISAFVILWILLHDEPGILDIDRRNSVDDL